MAANFAKLPELLRRKDKVQNQRKTDCDRSDRWRWATLFAVMARTISRTGRPRRRKRLQEHNDYHRNRNDKYT
jgi:hypothetical protein